MTWSDISHIIIYQDDKYIIAEVCKEINNSGGPEGSPNDIFCEDYIFPQRTDVSVWELYRSFLYIIYYFFFWESRES